MTTKLITKRCWTGEPWPRMSFGDEVNADGEEEDEGAAPR